MSRTRPLTVRPLTDAERQALQDNLRSPDAFVLRRAEIVLASAVGVRSGQIARRLGFTTQEVREVIQAFNARGLDVLRPGSYHSGVVGSALEGPQAHALYALLPQSARTLGLLPQSARTLGQDTSPWILEVAADVADEQGVPAQRRGGVTMRTTSARMAVRWPRAKEWAISPDLEYARQQAWCDRLIRLAQWHPSWLLGCADEVGPSRLAPPDPRGSVTYWRATRHPPAPAPSQAEGGYPRSSPLPRTGRGAGGESTSSLRQDNSQTLPDLHAGQDDDHAVHLINQTVTCDDSEPETQPQRVRFAHVPRYAMPRPPLRLRRRTAAVARYPGPVLAVDNLQVTYTDQSGTTPVLRAVSLEIDVGEALGLVGERGCGKSTLAFALMRSLGRAGRVTGGQILFQGHDLLALSDAAWRRIRGRRMTLVSQAPQSLLNPSLAIGTQLAEVFRVHWRMDKPAAWAAAERMLEQVQIADAAAVLRRYPHQLTGDLQQRVGLALALATDPDLLIMDEPTTGLDVTVEAAVLDLVADLRRAFHFAILLISHNLDVIARVCDRVGVLYAGAVVEQGTVEDIVRAPRHPYTVDLLESLPHPDQHRRGSPGRDAHRASPDRPGPAGLRCQPQARSALRLLRPLPGQGPSPQATPPGCTFAPRCPLARPACSEGQPDLEVVSTTQLSRCFFWQEVGRPDVVPGVGIDDGTRQAEAADHALPALTPLLHRGHLRSEPLSTPNPVVHARGTYVPRPALLRWPTWLRRLSVSTLALMLTLLPLREHVIGKRTAHPYIQWCARHREALWVAGIALVAALAHGINMFNYPVYLGDEGIYTAQAWAVMKEAKLDPFTYTYGHAPAGWILLAAWAVLTGGFHTFGTTIDSGRVLMLILQVGATCMLYHIARRISHSITVASAACLLFALSPYGIYSHREVLLDNIATFWMLLSIMLLVSRRLSLSRVWLSAVSLGLSILSKENTMFIVPALTYLVFYRTHRSHRWFATVGWPMVVVSLVSLYMLMATIKGELFPTGTLLGGTHPHVSLLSSLQWQTNREKDRGLMDFNSKFWQATRFWVQADPLVVAGGSFCAFLAVLAIKRQRLVGVMGAATLSLWIFLARGSVILDFYLVPPLPLSALSVALVLGLAANSVTTFFKRYSGLSPIVTRSMQIAVVAPCLAGLAIAYSSPALGLKNDPLLLWKSWQEGAAVREAVTWAKENIPSCSKIIVDPIMWTDLRDRQNMNNDFRFVYTHWEAATDPAIRDVVFQGNWRNVDYEIVTPGTMFDMRANRLRLVQDVWAHSTVIARFDQKRWPIKIGRVNSGKARPSHTCGSHGGR
jgi:oligopeptide/dipeptide ABC transporter ATP-binding protein